MRIMGKPYKVTEEDHEKMRKSLKERMENGSLYRSRILTYSEPFLERDEKDRKEDKTETPRT